MLAFHFDSNLMPSNSSSNVVLISIPQPPQTQSQTIMASQSDKQCFKHCCQVSPYPFILLCREKQLDLSTLLNTLATMLSSKLQMYYTNLILCYHILNILTVHIVIANPSTVLVRPLVLTCYLEYILYY